MFPIYIDTSATNDPSKEGYPCAGTVQCIGYQGPNSWEAVLVVGSADEDQTPRGDYYKAHLSYDMGGSAWVELTTGSSSGTALSLSRVETNDFGDYDTLYAILNQTGDMVAIFADHPDSGPSSNGGTYVGTAQLDKDYSDAIIYDVYNVHTNTRYRGYVSSAGQVGWTGAHRDVAKTISVSDFTPAALFASPYNFHLYPSGTMIPIEGDQQAEQGPFPESVYENGRIYHGSIRR